METIYGTSLGLDIPRLKCKRSDIPIVRDEVECNREDAFAREHRDPSIFVDINQYILDMINASVDFFVQYNNASLDDRDLNLYLQTLLDLKKIIFSFTGLEYKATFTSLFDMFTKTKKRSFLDHINPEFNVVLNMGRVNMVLQNIKPLNLRQKLTNLYLLVLSYKILSMSGILGIDIMDIEDVIKNEKKRKTEKQEQSFILQFLPKDVELLCFQDVEFFFLREMNTVIFQKINALVPPESDRGGGSKRSIFKKHNKSRKNKSKKYKYRKNKSKNRK